MVKKIARGGAKNISRSGKQIKQLNNYRITSKTTAYSRVCQELHVHVVY